MNTYIKGIRLTKEELDLAKEKAKVFKNTKLERMQSIRLTSDETSYTIFYQDGVAYIGTYSNEKLPKVYTTRTEYDLTDNDTGKVTATMQELIRL